MKRLQPVLALFCALVLCAAAMPVTVLAADATVTVGSVTAKPGDTIEIPVTVTRADNVGGLEVHVAYDSAVLECVDAVLGDAVSSYMMKNVNTTPVNVKDQVWLTVLGNPATVEGELMRITFKVRADAAGGDTALTMVPDRTAVLVGLEAKALDIVLANGTVTVEGGAVTPPATTTKAPTTTKATTAEKVTTTTAAQEVTTTAAPTTSVVSGTDNNNTTTATQATIPSGMVAVEGEDGQTMTRADGEPVTVPSQETLLDHSGNVVTDVNGEPSMAQAIAVMLDEMTAEPGETVAVKLSVSSVAELTMMCADVKYDTKVLSFEGGECIGFAKDLELATVMESKDGIISINLMDPRPVSGGGAVAELRFKVKKSAVNGKYSLLVSNPTVSTNDVNLPVKVFDGEIRVEGGEEQSGMFAMFGLGAVTTVLVIAIPVAAVILISVAAFVVLRIRKKAAQANADHK